MDEVGEINVTEFELTKDPIGWSLVVSREDQAPIKRIIVRMFTIQDNIHGCLDNVYIERVGKHFRVVGVGYKGRLGVGKLLALKTEHERIRDVYIDFDYVDSHTKTQHPPCIVVNYEGYETVVDCTAARERAVLGATGSSAVPVVIVDDYAGTTTATVGKKRNRRNRHKRSSSWLGSFVNAIGFGSGGEDMTAGSAGEEPSSKRVRMSAGEDSDSDTE